VSEVSSSDDSGLGLSGGVDCGSGLIGGSISELDGLGGSGSFSVSILG